MYSVVQSTKDNNLDDYWLSPPNLIMTQCTDGVGVGPEHLQFRTSLLYLAGMLQPLSATYWSPLPYTLAHRVTDLHRYKHEVDLLDGDFEWLDGKTFSEGSKQARRSSLIFNPPRLGSKWSCPKVPLIPHFLEEDRGNYGLLKVKTEL